MLSLSEIYRILNDEYGNLNWWPAENTFEMMCGAILTQNTAWSNVEKAIAGFDGRLSPEYVRSAAAEELAEIIRPAGFFNQKAVRLKCIAEWYGRYNDDNDRVAEIPTAELREKLLALNGVGKETADSILVYGFERLSFVVDAYTRRLLGRLGYELPKEYDEIREMVEDNISSDIKLYNQFHALIVEHCKCHCLKRPKCSGCVLEEYCVFYKERHESAAE